MKKILILIFFCAGFGILNSKAQILNLNYQMSAPIGDSRNFINKMSFRGASLDYHHFVTDRFAVGLSVGWNTFYKHLNKATGGFLLNGEKVTITGDQFRYLNVVPVLASARYFFTDEDALICPYAGIGIGTNWAESRLEVGHFVAKEEGWQFAFAPEVGCIVPFSEYIGLNLGIRYQYSVKASGLPSLQDLGIKVGISLMF